MLRIFLDTSAQFAGIWSEEGAARAILRLGEAGALRLVVSSEVLAEIESVLKEKAPELLAQVVLLLDICGFETISSAPPLALIEEIDHLVPHPADAAIIAVAMMGDIDYFVTHDAAHFLNNTHLKQRAPFPIGFPGGCLAWYRMRLVSDKPEE